MCIFLWSQVYCNGNTVCNILGVELIWRHYCHVQGFLHVETFHWIILQIIYRTRDNLYRIYSEGACQFNTRPCGLVWILTRPFAVNQIQNITCSVNITCNHILIEVSENQQMYKIFLFTNEKYSSCSPTMHRLLKVKLNPMHLKKETRYEYHCL